MIFERGPGLRALFPERGRKLTIRSISSQRLTRLRAPFPERGRVNAD